MDGEDEGQGEGDNQNLIISSNSNIGASFARICAALSSQRLAALTIPSMCTSKSSPSICSLQETQCGSDATKMRK